MLTNILIIFSIVAVAIIGLLIYAKVSKSDKVLMEESCHGNCTECRIDCKSGSKK